MLKSIVVASCLCLISLQSAAAQKSQYFMPVSELKARLWSVCATVTPMVVGGGLLYASRGEGSDDFVIWGLSVGSAGLVFGPGAGHAYAKQWDRALIGTAIRGVGVGLFLWGVTTLEFYITGETVSGGTPSELFIAAGILMVVMSASHDLITVGRSVDKFNHSHGFSDVRITPTYFASYKAPGVMLTMSFQ